MNSEGRTLRVAVHATEARSQANGPGRRYVVWFQGCTLACRGCFNPETHQDSRDTEGPNTTDVAELARSILAHQNEIEGVTISGGEPFQQPEALAELLATVRGQSSLSTLVFSGYRLAELQDVPARAASLPFIDVLIDGRYQDKKRVGTSLLGSANQRIHLLSSRYTMNEVAATPQAEVRIGADGLVTLTGVNPLKLD